ncbi:hypothetical protein CUJ84_Chr000738 [Rhizobium leguminosarum]|uniref:Uncharacterized protein n=1 Tax=Rhizobium leguminosarum TaxID=384 RepID=A0A2K9YYS0_RHILE|nr:hypothetical protein CUJ84_Chr000738 [Rhizobium leguminosarum]
MITCRGMVERMGRDIASASHAISGDMRRWNEIEIVAAVTAKGLCSNSRFNVWRNPSPAALLTVAWRFA